MPAENCTAFAAELTRLFISNGRIENFRQPRASRVLAHRATLDCPSRLCALSKAPVAVLKIAPRRYESTSWHPAIPTRCHSTDGIGIVDQQPDCSMDSPSSLVIDHRIHPVAPARIGFPAEFSAGCRHWLAAARRFPGSGNSTFAYNLYNAQKSKPAGELSWTRSRWRTPSSKSMATK